MAQSSKKKAAEKQGRKRKVATYRIDSRGNLIGPDGKKIHLVVGDTPIVISGGSLKISSVGELDDDQHPGQRTKRLRQADGAKHITSVQFIGFSPDGGSTDTFIPDDPTDCTIIIHYG